MSIFDEPVTSLTQLALGYLAVGTNRGVVVFFVP